MKPNAKLPEFKLGKELFIIEIETTVTFRYQRAEQFPHDKEKNIKAAEALQRLSIFVENLPDVHQVFIWWLSTTSDMNTEYAKIEIRQFGFQNLSETPEMFIDRLVSEGIKRNLFEDYKEWLN